MTDESATTSNGSDGSTRKKLLFGVLALLIIALAYDYRFARAGVDVAYNQIVDRNIEVNADSTSIFTNMDVRQLLAREPARTFTDANGDLVEVFSWRSGLLIKTHDLFTVYKPSDGKQMFYRHAKYRYDTSKEVSNHSVPQVVLPADGVDEEPDGGMDQFDGGEGSSTRGGPGGGPGGRGGSGRGFDPEAIFAERDVDGDGLWKDDEISQRARENLADIDKDGDGAISKDEWMARMEAMRAQFGGGGGPGGGSSRPPRQSRPELESDDETTDDEAAADPEKTKPEPETEKPETEKPATEKPETEKPATEKPDAGNE